MISKIEILNFNMPSDAKKCRTSHSHNYFALIHLRQMLSHAMAYTMKHWYQNYSILHN